MARQRALYSEIPIILTFQNVCDILGISKNTLRKLMQENDLDYYKVGKQIRFRKEDLEEYISMQLYRA